jgi:hypothetical protein
MHRRWRIFSQKHVGSLQRESRVKNEEINNLKRQWSIQDKTLEYPVIVTFYKEVGGVNLIRCVGSSSYCKIGVDLHVVLFCVASVSCACLYRCAGFFSRMGLLGN